MCIERIQQDASLNNKMIIKNTESYKYLGYQGMKTIYLIIEIFNEAGI